MRTSVFFVVGVATFAQLSTSISAHGNTNRGRIQGGLKISTGHSEGTADSFAIGGPVKRETAHSSSTQVGPELELSLDRAFSTTANQYCLSFTVNTGRTSS